MARLSLHCHCFNSCSRHCRRLHSLNQLLNDLQRNIAASMIKRPPPCYYLFVLLLAQPYRAVFRRCLVEFVRYERGPTRCSFLIIPMSSFTTRIRCTIRWTKWVTGSKLKLISLLFYIDCKWPLSTSVSPLIMPISLPTPDESLSYLLNTDF